MYNEGDGAFWEVRSRRPLTAWSAAVIDDVTLRRFWSKVAIQDWDSCWVWTAASGSYGHGQFFLNGKLTSAHRAAWIMFRGEISAGLEVCHHCDNPPCVNTSHLFIGTHADNMRDMRQKGRMVTPETKGEANSSAKITEKDVIYIRQSSLKQFELAKEFGLTRATISDIQLGLTWPHLPFARSHKLSSGHVGSSHPKALITEDDVLHIRASSERSVDLAKKYGLAPTTISNIRKRRIWKHVA